MYNSPSSSLQINPSLAIVVTGSTLINWLDQLDSALEEKKADQVQHYLDQLCKRGNVIGIQSDCQPQFLTLLHRSLRFLVKNKNLPLNKLNEYYTLITAELEYHFLTSLSLEKRADFYREQGETYTQYNDMVAFYRAEQCYLKSLVLQPNPTTQQRLVILTLKLGLQILIQRKILLPVGEQVEVREATCRAEVETRLSQSGAAPFQLVYLSSSENTGSWALAFQNPDEFIVWISLKDCSDFLWRNDPELKTQSFREWQIKSSSLCKAFLQEIADFGKSYRLQSLLDTLWHPAQSLIEDLIAYGEQSWVRTFFELINKNTLEGWELHLYLDRWKSHLHYLESGAVRIPEQIDHYLTQIDRWFSYGQTEFAKKACEFLLDQKAIYHVSENIREDLRQKQNQQKFIEHKYDASHWTVSTQACQDFYTQISRTDTDFVTAQQQFTQRIRQQLTVQIKACVEICGEPPSSFNVIAMGSLTQSLLAPHSDLDIAILLPETVTTIHRDHSYWPIFLHLLNSRMIALSGAYLSLDRGDLEHMGWKSPLDEKTEIKSAPRLLINTASGYIRELFSLSEDTDESHPEFRHGLMRPYLVYAHKNNPEPYQQYCDALKKRFTEVKSEHFAKRDWRWMQREWQRIQKHLLDPHSPEVQLKQDIIRPLLNWLLAAGLYGNITQSDPELPTVTILTQPFSTLLAHLTVGEGPVIHPNFGYIVNSLLTRWLKLRVQLHQISRATQQPQTNGIGNKDQRDVILKANIEIKSSWLEQLTNDDWADIQCATEMVIPAAYAATATDKFSLPINPVFFPRELSEKMIETRIDTWLSLCIRHHLHHPELYVHYYQQCVNERWASSLQESLRLARYFFETLQKYLLTSGWLSLQQEQVRFAVGHAPLPDGTRLGWQDAENQWRTELTSLCVSKSEETAEIKAYQEQKLPLLWITGLPIATTDQKEKKSDSLPRYLLKITLANALITPQGQWKKTLGLPGKRTVIAVPDAKQPRYYWKILPELPGIERAIGELAQRFIGKATAFTQLVTLQFTDIDQHPLKQHPRLYPVLISEAIHQVASLSGKNFEDALVQDPQLAQISLDPKQLTQWVLLSLLIQPEDGTPHNFVVANLPHFSHAQLIGIDNDHHFVKDFIAAGLLRSEKVFKQLSTEYKQLLPEDHFATQILQVKTILYCLDFMQRPLSREAIQEFLQLDLSQVLKSWLVALHPVDVQHQSLLSPQDSQFYFKSDPKAFFSYLRPVFDAKTIIKVYQVAHRLYRVLSDAKKPPITPMDLVMRIHPLIGRRYRLVHETLPNASPSERLKWLTDEWKNLPGLHSPSLSTGVDIIKRNEGDDSLMEQIKKDTAHYPDKALPLLMQMIQETGALELPRAALRARKIQPSGLVILLRDQFILPDHRALLVSEINFQQISILHQNEILNILKNSKSQYELLRLNHVTTLREADWDDLVLKSPNLQRLFLNYCQGITNSFIEQLAFLCPVLVRLSLTGVSLSLIGKKTPLVFTDLRFVKIRRCPALEVIFLKAPRLEYFLADEGCDSYLMYTDEKSSSSTMASSSRTGKANELLVIDLTERLSVLTAWRDKLSFKQSQSSNDKAEKEIERMEKLISQLEEQRLAASSSESKQSTFISTYEEVEVPGDGHCLYSAVGLYVGQDQKQLRGQVANELETKLQTYASFLELKSQQTSKQYIESVRQGSEWASNAEITALMHILQRPIVVVRPDENPQVRIQNPTEMERQYSDKGLPILVSYNGKNHYNALIRVARDDSHTTFSQNQKTLNTRLFQLIKDEKLSRKNAYVFIRSEQSFSCLYVKNGIPQPAEQIILKPTGQFDRLESLISALDKRSEKTDYVLLTPEAIQIITLNTSHTHNEEKTPSKLKYVHLIAPQLKRFSLKNHTALTECILEINQPKAMQQFNLRGCAALKKLILQDAQQETKPILWPPKHWAVAEDKITSDSIHQAKFYLSLAYLFLSDQWVTVDAKQGSHWWNLYRKVDSQKKLANHFVNEVLGLSAIIHLQTRFDWATQLIKRISLPALGIVPYSSLEILVWQMLLYAVESNYLSWLTRLSAVIESKTWHLVKDHEGNTLCHLALRQGDDDIIGYCIDQHWVDPDAKNTQGRTPFLEAVFYGHVFWMKKILLQFPDQCLWLERDVWGNSALHLAVISKNQEIIDWCAEKKELLSSINLIGQTPFLYAAAKNTAAMNQIIKHDPDALYDIDHRKQTALHLDLSTGGLIESFWSDHDIPLGHKDKNGYTPFHTAILWGQFKSLLWLIQNYSYPFFVDQDNELNSALHLAFYQDNDAIVALLLEHRNRDLQHTFLGKNRDGRTALHVAARCGRTKWITVLVKHLQFAINETDNMGTTPLLLAAREGHLDCVQALVQLGADIGKIDHFGDNALTLARYHRRQAAIQWLEPLTLMQHDQAKNSPSTGKKVDIFFAAQQGDFKTVHHLLKQGQSLQQCDAQGRNLLMVTAQQEHKEHLDLLEWLSMRGCNVEHKDIKGKNAYLLAAEAGCTLSMKYLQRASATTIGSKDKEGNTALLLATRHGHLKAMLQLIVDQPEELEVPNRRGSTPFLVALAYGYHTIANTILEFFSNIKQPDVHTLAFNTELRQLDFSNSLISHSLLCLSLGYIAYNSTLKILKLAQCPSANRGTVLEALAYSLFHNRTIVHLTYPIAWEQKENKTQFTQIKQHLARNQRLYQCWATWVSGAVVAMLERFNKKRNLADGDFLNIVSGVFGFLAEPAPTSAGIKCLRKITMKWTVFANESTQTPSSPTAKLFPSTTQVFS